LKFNTTTRTPTLKFKGIIMDIKTAIKIIDDKREIYGMSFFDMLLVMEEMLSSDELDNREAVAFRVFMREGRKMFAPA